MKKPGFLAKLAKEGRLMLVEPSDEIAKAYLERSEESLSSAKNLMGFGNLRDSAALAYYAMYHCLLALLFKNGIKCENHSAAIKILKEVFGLDNSAIEKAKRERTDQQYYVDFEISKSEVQLTITSAERFISVLIDFINKLSFDDVQAFRKKFAGLIS